MSEITCAECLDAIRARLKGILVNQCYPFDGICRYAASASGKNIRARVGIACGCNEQGLVSDKIIDSLCAVELLHLATLIHDDIIDNADTRRGIASVQAKFGKAAALVTGDYMFTMCFSLIAGCDPDLLPHLSKTVAFICKGEMRQDLNRYNNSISAMEYCRIISGKTAALFALSAVIGSRSVCKRNNIKNYFKVGYHIGMAFQIADDIKDLTSGHSDKPVMNDLTQGFITLPVILGGTGIENGIASAATVADKYKSKAKSEISGFNNSSSAKLLDIIEMI